MESCINCGFCFKDTRLHLLNVGFEDGSFVEFLPGVIGFHGRSSLWHRGTARPCQGAGTLQRENVSSVSHQPNRGSGKQPFRLPARRFISFRKKPSRSALSCSSLPEPQKCQNETDERATSSETGGKKEEQNPCRRPQIASPPPRTTAKTVARRMARLSTDLSARLWSGGICTRWMTIRGFAYLANSSSSSKLFRTRLRACSQIFENVRL
jgi:hypothetical protein